MIEEFVWLNGILAGSIFRGKRYNMNNSAEPFFSVIVPLYNNHRDLENCIASIPAHTCTDYEVILVDDGSTDGSSRICDRFVERDNTVKAIHKNDT